MFGSLISPPYRGKRFVLYICTHVRKWILFLSNLSVPPISVHFQNSGLAPPLPSIHFSPRFFYCCDHFTFYILTHNLPPLLLLRHVRWNFATTKNRQKMGNSLTIFFNFVWNFISVVVNWILSSGRGPADATKTRTCATYYYYCKKNGLWLLDCHSRSSDFLVRAREFWQLFPSHSFLRNSWVFLLFFPATFFSPSWSKIIRKTRGVFLDVSKRKILKTRNPKKENKKNAQNGSINKFWEKS